MAYFGRATTEFRRFLMLSGFAYVDSPIPSLELELELELKQAMHLIASVAAVPEGDVAQLIGSLWWLVTVTSC